MRKWLFFLAVLLTVFLNMEAVSAEVLYKTYIYSYWGETIPTPNAYVPLKVIDGDMLGIGKFKEPEDIFVSGNGEIYVVDSGNNRIILMDKYWKVLKVIDGFSYNGRTERFNKPEGIFVNGEDRVFIADTGNGRIVELDSGGNCVRILGRPETELLPENLEYMPEKLTVDKAGRVYVIARNVNQGLMELDRNGGFKSFLGANRVTPNMVDYFWKSIATEEQRKRLELFVPTEYDNIDIDNEGFLYLVTSNLDNAALQREIESRGAAGKITPVRRLNPSGVDVLKRKGYFPPVGDVKISETTQSRLVDVCVDECGIYSVLDSKMGRIFTYDFDGNLLYVFGCMGEQVGAFKQPSAIEMLDHQIVVLDRALNRITVFDITMYGGLVRDAVRLHYMGKYEEAAQKWERVLTYNANYDLAYTGIGKAYLRKDMYAEAMESFKLGNNREYYSKAYKLYRKEVIEKNIAYVLLTFIVLVVVILKRGRSHFSREVDM